MSSIACGSNCTPRETSCVNPERNSECRLAIKRCALGPAGRLVGDGGAGHPLGGGEDHRGAGPEALELGARLVGQRDAGLHEVLARAAERQQRLGLIAVGHHHAEAVTVGARTHAEHERVEAVGLAARGPKTRSDGVHLVGMDRHHPQPGVEQPLDHEPVRALDRGQLHSQPHKGVAQRGQVALII